MLAIGAALTAIASNASAQNCGQWGDVVAWQASYAFTGSGGGTTTDGMLVYTWTVNRQFTATATLTSYVSCGEVPGVLAWSGPASTASGSGSSNGQTTQTSPDCGGPFVKINWSGNAPSLGSFFDGAPPQLQLQINLSNQTYTVLDDAAVSGTISRNDCGHGTSNSLGLTLGPLWSYYTAGGSQYIDLSPKSFRLPQTIGILQQTTSFAAPAETYPLDSNAIPSTTWNLNFKLTPLRPWEKVWMSGGSSNPAAASRERR